MKWSFRIATVAGIEVRVHVTFLLLVAFYGFTFATLGGSAAAIHGVTFVLLLFCCVLLHEFGHAFAARYFGIRTPDITLLPIGGVARLERMPSSPWAEFVIAVAGPAVNVAIAGALIVAMGGLPSPQHLDPNRILDYSIPVGLLTLNLWLIAFNMIPAFPMDGGRVLRAVLAMRFSHATATLIAARVGQGVAVLFVLAGLQRNPILALIGMFVFIGAGQELAYSRMRQAARNLRVGSAMITRFATLPVDLPSGEATTYLIGSNQAVFPFVGPDLSYHGLANRDDLLRAADGPPDAALGAIARQVPPVRPEMGFDVAFELMQKTGEPVLPVLNAAGQIVGLVSAGQLRGESPDSVLAEAE